MIFLRAGKAVLARFYAVFAWWLNLFNPPPREAMNWSQKMGRILLVSVSLVITCVVAAMLGALGLYVLERGRQMFDSTPELMAGLSIIFVGVWVNGICVLVLLEIKKADAKLMASPPPKTGEQL